MEKYWKLSLNYHQIPSSTLSLWAEILLGGWPDQVKFWVFCFIWQNFIRCSIPLLAEQNEYNLTSLKIISKLNLKNCTKAWKLHWICAYSCLIGCYLCRSRKFNSVHLETVHSLKPVAIYISSKQGVMIMYCNSFRNQQWYCNVFNMIDPCRHCIKLVRQGVGCAVIVTRDNIFPSF